MKQDSALKFYPLTFVPDDTDVIVGRRDTNTNAVFPCDGVALLQQLQMGLSVEEATQWYEQQYGEAIDIGDFLHTLQELHFIREDHQPFEAEQREDVVSALCQRLGHAAFSPLAWMMYGALFLLSAYYLMRFPILLPRARNVFFSPYLSLEAVLIFVGQLPFVVLHEFFHVLGGWRLGLPAKLRIGHRLHFIVFETSLDGLWSVPRRARYLPFLAGMLADVSVFSLLNILAGLSIQFDGLLTPIGSMCSAFAFLTLLRIQWQCYFYLQTDLYYVIENAFGCADLHGTAQRFIHNLFLWCTGRAGQMEDPANWHPRDRQMVRWYAPFYFFGYLVTIVSVFYAILPMSWQFLIRMITAFSSGTVKHPDLFWDSCLLLVLCALQLAVVCILYWRRSQQGVV